MILMNGVRAGVSSNKLRSESGCRTGPEEHHQGKYQVSADIDWSHHFCVYCKFIFSTLPAFV